MDGVGEKGIKKAFMYAFFIEKGESDVPFYQF